MIDIVVPVSGGKDSQACLKLAVTLHPSKNIIGLFCDTQWEHPLTYEHIDKLADLYNVQIYRISGGSVVDKIRKYQRFPMGGARFCTDELKIRETKLFCKNLGLQQGGFEVWYGMRSGEGPARKKRYLGKVSDEVYMPHEVLPGKYPKYLAKMGVSFRLPILDWTTAEVVSFVGKENLNPLYDTFDRVGCFPCLAAGDGPKKKAFSFDSFGREQYKTVMMLQEETGKSVWTKEPENGCLFCEM